MCSGVGAHETVCKGGTHQMWHPCCIWCSRDEREKKSRVFQLGINAMYSFLWRPWDVLAILWFPNLAGKCARSRLLCRERCCDSGTAVLVLNTISLCNSIGKSNATNLMPCGQNSHQYGKKSENRLLLVGAHKREQLLNTLLWNDRF